MLYIKTKARHKNTETIHNVDKNLSLKKRKKKVFESSEVFVVNIYDICNWHTYSDVFWMRPSVQRRAGLNIHSSVSCDINQDNL